MPFLSFFYALSWVGQRSGHKLSGYFAQSLFCALLSRVWLRAAGISPRTPFQVELYGPLRAKHGPRGAAKLRRWSLLRGQAGSESKARARSDEPVSFSLYPSLSPPLISPSRKSV